MTIVVYRDGVMAADTEIAEGNIRCGRIPKITRLPDGTVIGVCGELSASTLFVKWARSGYKKGKRPNLDDRFQALIATPDGGVLCIEGDGPSLELDDDFFAIGSGSDVALGALEAGATAEEACKAACRRVHGCSEPVMSIKV